MRKVYCLNGHDATGVEGFTCSLCGAELRTVLGNSRAPAPRPERLLAVIVLLPTVLVALLTTSPPDVDAAGGRVLVPLTLIGATMWLAACLWISSRFSRVRPRASGC